jgi:hypothetical protein
MLYFKIRVEHASVPDLIEFASAQACRACVVEASEVYVTTQHTLLASAFGDCVQWDMCPPAATSAGRPVYESAVRSGTELRTRKKKSGVYAKETSSCAGSESCVYHTRTCCMHALPNNMH